MKGRHTLELILILGNFLEEFKTLLDKMFPDDLNSQHFSIGMPYL